MRAAVRGHLTLVERAAMGMALMFLATTANAQSMAWPAPPATPLASAATTAAAQQTTAQTQTEPTEAPTWALIGGYEFDTQGTGYAFLGPAYTRPFRSNMAWTARVFPNYLYYEFDDGLGLNKVKSPGVSTGVGLQFGTTSRVGIQAGPSFKRRTRTFERGGTSTEVTENVVGISVGGDVYANPTPTTNVHALVDYGSADKYLWSRLGVKEQISNRDNSGTMSHSVGGEVIAQGSEDIRSLQFGGLFEFVHVPSSLSLVLRSGYKRSTFDVGPDKTGPYFGIGFYKRLN